MENRVAKPPPPPEGGTFAEIKANYFRKIIVLLINNRQLPVLSLLERGWGEAKN